MRLRDVTVVGCAMLLTLAGCAPAEMSTPAPAATHVEAPAVAKLRADLEAAVTAGQIPGATVMIARNGRLLADVTTGWADIEGQRRLEHDSLFRLYSMSKPITSVAIMMLVDQGKLRLGDAVERYLPEFKGLRVYESGGLNDMVTVPANRPMTIEDLLTHRSGLTYHFAGTTPVHQYYRKFGVLRDTPVGRMPDDGAPARSLDELMARLGRAPLLNQPGETFAYSYSTTVLGAVIERVTKQRLDRYLQRSLFGPLGMKDTGFVIGDAHLPRFTVLYGPKMMVVEDTQTSDYRNASRLLDGGGAIFGSASDYLRFAQMLANGGTLNGRRYLRTQSVDAMLVSCTTVSGVAPKPLQFGYGFLIGDSVSEEAMFQPAGTAGWAGSGGTVFFIDRRRKAVALLMTHILGGSEQVRASVVRAAIDLTAD